MNDPWDAATISLNCFSQEYREEQRERNQDKRAAQKVMKDAEKRIEIAGQQVKGLCPKKDSCLVCRTARMADKEYMKLVNVRLIAWGKYSHLCTVDNSIAHSSK